MDKLREHKPNAAVETDFEALVGRESEEALRRFRAGDFAARLKSRLEASPAPKPLILFRRPALIPALSVLVLAGAVLAVLLLPSRGNGRFEAGFRFLSETLAKTDLLRDGGRALFSDGPVEPASGRDPRPFSEILGRAAAGWGPETGRASGPSGEGGAPLRPLFSPGERMKILYGDRAILRALTAIASQKEV